MAGGRYEVDIEFEAEVRPGKSMGKARAIELVTVGPGGLPAENPIGDLRQAKVKRIGEVPGHLLTRGSSE